MKAISGADIKDGRQVLQGVDVYTAVCSWENTRIVP